MSTTEMWEVSGTTSVFTENFSPAEATPTMASPTDLTPSTTDARNISFYGTDALGNSTRLHNGTFYGLNGTCLQSNGSTLYSKGLAFYSNNTGLYFRGILLNSNPMMFYTDKRSLKLNVTTLYANLTGNMSVNFPNVTFHNTTDTLPGESDLIIETAEGNITLSDQCPSDLALLMNTTEGNGTSQSNTTIPTTPMTHNGTSAMTDNGTSALPNNGTSAMPDNGTSVMPEHAVTTLSTALNLWPSGQYSLPVPRGECPEKANFTKDNAFVEQSLRSFLQAQGITFCQRLADGMLPISWDEGQYCVFAANASAVCPGVLLPENITVDRFGGSSLTLRYCCADIHSERPITMPRTSPFYLLPIMNQPCTEVAGMNSTVENTTVKLRNIQYVTSSENAPAYFWSPDAQALTFSFCRYTSPGMIMSKPGATNDLDTVQLVAIIVSVCLIVVIIVVVIACVVLRRRRKAEGDPDISVIELPSVEEPSSGKGRFPFACDLGMSFVCGHIACSEDYT
ncbi:uncharacterized protein LOC135481071 [Liolophura sinensis]|uniref:uncharacterized protein LOC135481071 n=1 Tax=Liolophura sinensis TaxID=3198878 RepID=UPI00315946D7